MEEKQIIPIARFDNGEAERIFTEVERDGLKIVVDNNNKAVCILLSLEKFEALIKAHAYYEDLVAAELIIAELSDGALGQSHRTGDDDVHSS